MREMRWTIGVLILCIGVLSGCSEKEPPQTWSDSTIEQLSGGEREGMEGGESLEEEFEYDAMGNKVYTNMEEKGLFGRLVYERKVERKKELTAEDFKDLEYYNGYQSEEGNWIEEAVGAYDGFISDDKGRKHELYYILGDGTYALCMFYNEKTLEHLCRVDVIDSKGNDIFNVFAVRYDNLGNRIDLTIPGRDEIFGYQATESKIERKKPLKKEDLIKLLGYSNTEIKEVLGENEGLLFPCNDKYTSGVMLSQKIPYYILEDGTYALCYFNDESEYWGNPSYESMNRLEFRNEEGEILEEVFYQPEE